MGEGVRSKEISPGRILLDRGSPSGVNSKVNLQANDLRKCNRFTVKGRAAS